MEELCVLRGNGGVDRNLQEILLVEDEYTSSDDLVYALVVDNSEIFGFYENGLAIETTASSGFVRS